MPGKTGPITLTQSHVCLYTALQVERRYSMPFYECIKFYTGSRVTKGVAFTLQISYITRDLIIDKGFGIKVMIVLQDIKPLKLAMGNLRASFRDHLM